MKGPASGHELGAWLRRQREARCWTRSELAHRIIKAARDHGDNSMPSVEDVCANIYRWERGRSHPRDGYKFYCCYAFGIPASRFGIDEIENETGYPCFPAGHPALAALYFLAGIFGLRRDFSGDTLTIRMESGDAGLPGHHDAARPLRSVPGLD